MGKDKVGMVRRRVFFEDHRLLNNSQLSDGLRRCWVLIQPNIVTVADLASHLREKFAIPNCLLLFIDDFVLPPFESTCIIKIDDIIRVKLKDALLLSDDQSGEQDSQIANAHDTMADEESIEKSQENGSDENAFHGSNLSPGIETLEQKREPSLELCNSVSKRSKRQKLNCTGKQVTCAGVQDMHSERNRTYCHENVGSKMELLVKDKTHDDGLGVSQPVSEVSLGEPSISDVSLGKPSSSASCKGRPQSMGMNNALKSEFHIACDVTKENVQSSVATTKSDQNKFTTMTFNGRNCCSDDKKKDSNGFCTENSAWIDRNLGGDSSANEAKAAKYKIDFATLFPLTRSPLRGDVLAYRYVEPSSTAYPVFSLPRVGKVKAFDHKSSEIVLIPAPEFEVFLEENRKTPVLPQISSPYKRDGSLEIKLSALIDVRLLKAHDLKDLACLPQETINRTKKDKWEMALANQSDAQHPGRANGAEHTASERRTSTPWYRGSPSADLFWETVLSKGAFGN